MAVMLRLLRTNVIKRMHVKNI